MNQDSHRDLLVGIDVGGTKVAVLVIDSRYQVRAQAKSPTNLDSPEATLSGIAEAVRRAVELAGGQMSQVARVGLGVPGRVDMVTGSVRRAVNLHSGDLPVGPSLSRPVGGAVPAGKRRDAGRGRRAAIHGRRSRPEHGVRERGHRGGRWADPQWPYIQGGTRHGGRDRAYGYRLEGPPLPVRSPRLPGDVGGRSRDRAHGRGSSRGRWPHPLAPPPAGHKRGCDQAAREGDPAALAITHKAAGYLALALQQLIVSYDVECIVFGGGVSRAGDAFLQPVERSRPACAGTRC